MKKHNLTFSPGFIGGLLVLAVACGLTFASCKKEKDPVDVNAPSYRITQSERLAIPAGIVLPDDLPDGNARVATFFADGVQNYRAQQKAGTNPAEYEWVFVAPQADLYDITNQKVGTHSAGPTWQLLGGADSIYGQAFTPARTAPSSDPSSIDWLLLMPKTGQTPTGIFADIAYIQRIDTRGGKAPSTPPSDANETVSVRYTAIYRFTKKN